MYWPERLTERLYRTRDGVSELYLVRRMLLPRNRYFNVFLHQFFASDEEGLHDHPCDFLLIGLKGWYWEDTFAGTTEREAGRVRLMTAETFHRIVVPRGQEGAVWTLAIRGPNRKTWGFLEPGLEDGWRRWNDAAKAARR